MKQKFACPWFLRRLKIRNLNLSTVIACLILLVAVLAAVCPSLLTSHDPEAIDMAQKFKGISAEHWLGTDEYGRDILARIIYGARASMLVGFGAAFAAMLIGVPLGMVAGYFGGAVDAVIMRIMDAFMSFPSMLLALLLMSIFDASVLTLILTITIVSYPAYGRIVRSSVLSVKECKYTEAARVSGASDAYIMFRTILPNCLGGIIVQFTLFAASSILLEAGLSFLGVGIQPPTPAWGSMLSYAKQYIYKSGLYIMAPAVTIFLVTLSINLIGDELRERLDPRGLRR